MVETKTLDLVINSERKDYFALHVLTGVSRNMLYTFTDGVVSVGRAEGACFKLVDKSVSRLHCQISVSNDNIVIKDCDSKNGTKVGGKSISEKNLTNGDVISIGDVSCAFLKITNGLVSQHENCGHFFFKDATEKFLFKETVERICGRAEGKESVTIISLKMKVIENLFENSKSINRLVKFRSCLSDVLEQNGFEGYSFITNSNTIMSVVSNASVTDLSSAMLTLRNELKKINQQNDMFVGIGLSNRDFRNDVKSADTTSRLVSEALNAASSGIETNSNVVYSYQKVTKPTLVVTSNVPRIPFSCLYQNSVHTDDKIFEVQLWLEHNYSKKINVADLADQFCMGTRNFKRRFKIATGVTPLEYIQKLRVEKAFFFLSNTMFQFDKITDLVGYSDRSSFTRLFKRLTGKTLSQVRTEHAQSAN